jgi:hypothetical protein
MKPSLTLTAAALLMAAAPALAHHSAAMFDATKTQVLAGTVTQFEYENPHAWVHLMVVGDDGKQTLFSIEMTSPNLLQRAGWRPSTLKPGDKVTIKIHPLHDGSAGGSLMEATLADGRVLTQNPAR